MRKVFNLKSKQSINFLFSNKLYTKKFSAAISAATPFFQPKLTINIPNDEYEQEADAMADKVMRMKEPAANETFFAPAIFSPSFGGGQGEAVQRKCDACEEEEKVKRKESSSELVLANNNIENDISSLNGSGKPLLSSSKQSPDNSEITIASDHVSPLSTDLENKILDLSVKFLLPYLSNSVQDIKIVPSGATANHSLS